MYVLLDTRGLVRAISLKSVNREDAKTEAFEMLSNDERCGCKTLEEYQDWLDCSQWYHISELELPTA